MTVNVVKLRGKKNFENLTEVKLNDSSNYAYFRNEVIQIGAMTAMIQIAKGLDIDHGAALLLVRQKENRSISDLKINCVETFFGLRTNYLAIASAKLAVAMRLGVDSGTVTEGLLAGETHYRGGLVRFVTADYGEWEIYTSFSGGTEDQDVQVALAGINMLFP